MDLASVVAALASVGVRVSGSTPNNNIQEDSSRACPTGLAGPEPSGTHNDPGQHFQQLSTAWHSTAQFSTARHSTAQLCTPARAHAARSRPLACWTVTDPATRNLLLCRRYGCVDRFLQITSTNLGKSRDGLLGQAFPLPHEYAVIFFVSRRGSVSTCIGFRVSQANPRKSMLRTRRSKRWKSYYVGLSNGYTRRGTYTL